MQNTMSHRLTVIVILRLIVITSNLRIFVPDHTQDRRIKKEKIKAAFTLKALRYAALKSVHCQIRIRAFSFMCALRNPEEKQIYARDLFLFFETPNCVSVVLIHSRNVNVLITKVELINIEKCRVVQ